MPIGSYAERELSSVRRFSFFVTRPRGLIPTASPRPPCKKLQQPPGPLDPPVKEPNKFG